MTAEFDLQDIIRELVRIESMVMRAAEDVLDDRCSPRGAKASVDEATADLSALINKLVDRAEGDAE